jgi:hypothetical protein
VDSLTGGKTGAIGDKLAPTADRGGAGRGDIIDKSGKTDPLQGRGGGGSDMVARPPKGDTTSGGISGKGIDLKDILGSKDGKGIDSKLGQSQDGRGTFTLDGKLGTGPAGKQPFVLDGKGGKIGDVPIIVPPGFLDFGGRIGKGGEPGKSSGAGSDSGKSPAGRGDEAGIKGDRGSAKGDERGGHGTIDGGSKDSGGKDITGKAVPGKDAGGKDPGGKDIGVKESAGKETGGKDGGKEISTKGDKQPEGKGGRTTDGGPPVIMTGLPFGIDLGPRLGFGPKLSPDSGRVPSDGPGKTSEPGKAPQSADSGVIINPQPIKPIPADSIPGLTGQGAAGGKSEAATAPARQPSDKQPGDKIPADKQSSDKQPGDRPIDKQPATRTGTIDAKVPADKTGAIDARGTVKEEPLADKPPKEKTTKTEDGDDAPADRKVAKNPQIAAENKPHKSAGPWTSSLLPEMFVIDDDSEEGADSEEKSLAGERVRFDSFDRDQVDPEEDLKESAAIFDSGEDPNTYSQASTYIVSNGETLELIATKLFQDRLLSILLLEINREGIQTTLHNGERLLDLRPGTVLNLPTVGQVREFNERFAMGLTSIFKYAGPAETPEDELAAWEEARKNQDD